MNQEYTDNLKIGTATRHIRAGETIEIRIGSRVECEAISFTPEGERYIKGDFVNPGEKCKHERSDVSFNGGEQCLDCGECLNT